MTSSQMTYFSMRGATELVIKVLVSEPLGIWRRAEGVQENFFKSRAVPVRGTGNRNYLPEQHGMEIASLVYHRRDGTHILP